MRRFVWYAFGIVIVALAGFGAAAVGMAIGDRTPPIEYTRGEALTPIVAPGGVLVVEFDVVRTRICPVVSSRYIGQDGEIEVVRVSEFKFRQSTKPGPETYTSEITLPLNLPLGRSYYQLALPFMCNWVQRIFSWPVEVASPRVYFTVVADPEAPFHQSPLPRLPP